MTRSPPPTETATEARFGSFVGRTAELAQLRELFASGARLVTLTGPGGVGKTRLAHEWLEASGAGRSRSFHFCDLADARSAEDICASVARALGIDLVATSTVDDASARVGHVLARRPGLLLVLDNFEQIVAHAPATVRVWLDAAEGTRILVTSRVRLRLRSERCLDLAPLPLPAPGESDSEAVQLFVERASAATASLGESPKDALAVAEIVRRLDGIPLAIELAAARMRTLGPTQLLARLSRRFDVLARGYRDASSRHATLRRTIDWSWELLSPRERSALAQTSVFRGGFTLEAAVAILDVDDVAAAVEALADSSLLRVEVVTIGAAERRFTLYETVREYAAERLDEAGERTATEERHAAYFVHIGEARARSSELLYAEIDNILAVVDRGLEPRAAGHIARVLGALAALQPVYGSTRPVTGYLERIDEALAVVGTRPAKSVSKPLARVLLARGDTLYRLGRMSEALVAFADAGKRAEGARDRGTRALVLRALGLVHHNQGRLREATARFEEALALARALGDEWLEAFVLAPFAFAQKNLGFSHELVPMLERARGLFERAGDVHEASVVEAQIATIFLELGELAAARTHYEAALLVFQRLGDRRWQAEALFGLGSVSLELETPAQAEAVFRRALALVVRTGFWRNEAIALCYLGVAIHLGGRLDEAREWYRRAVETFELGGDTPNVGMFEGYLGALECTAKDVRAAKKAFAAANRILANRDPVRRQVLFVHEGHLELAKLRRAVKRGDLAASQRHRRAVEQRATAPARSWALQSNDVRIAVRMLQEALDEEVAPASALVVGPDASWFRPPRGARVEFKRQRALRLILLALGARRVEAPGAPLATTKVLASGWPGERVMARAGANRVYVAMDTLRKLGLRDVLVRRENGWLLDPSVPFFWSP